MNNAFPVVSLNKVIELASLPMVLTPAPTRPCKHRDGRHSVLFERAFSFTSRNEPGQQPWDPSPAHPRHTTGCGVELSLQADLSDLSDSSVVVGSPMRPLAGLKLSMHVLVVVQRAQSANFRVCDSQEKHNKRRNTASDGVQRASASSLREPLTVRAAL